MRVLPLVQKQSRRLFVVQTPVQCSAVHLPSERFSTGCGYLCSHKGKAKRRRWPASVGSTVKKSQVKKRFKSFERYPRSAEGSERDFQCVCFDEPDCLG